MTFKLNPRMAEQLDRDPQVTRQLEDFATEALTAAQAIGRSIRRTGAYEESLYVDGNQLATNDPAGWVIEFGGRDSPVYAPLRKAAEQVGARVVDDRG